MGISRKPQLYDLIHDFCIDEIENLKFLLRNPPNPTPDQDLGYCFMTTTNDITSGAVGGTETKQVLISNPTGSQKVMRIFGLSVGTNVSTNNNIFRLYKDPTVTNNGTELTATNMNFGSTNLPVCKVYKTPTTSADGTLFTNIIAGQTTTVFHNFMGKSLLLPEGKKVLIGVRPNTTAVTYSVNLFWSEKAS